MAIYGVDGTEIFSAYGTDSYELEQAYDIEGNPLLETTPVEPDLVVMTYNYQWCVNINSQLAMQQEIINKYTPDIIGLQEAGRGNNAPTLFPVIVDTFLADYTRVLSDKASNRNGLATKLPISDYECVLFSQNDFENWDYQKCYITVANKRVAWYNTHLTYRTDAATLARKYSQVQDIITDIQNETAEYFIVTGDFNMYGKVFTGDEYIGVGKPFADLGFRLANWNSKVGFVRTFTDLTSATSLDEFRHACDNIIVSPNIRIINTVFDTTKLDYLDGNKIDHIPVICYLKML